MIKLRGPIIGALLLAVFVAAAAREKAPVSDDQLYDLVKRRLANDPVVKGGALEVEVHEGVVTLKGTVEQEKQKTKAERVTKKISGVKQVDNQLQVIGKPAR